MEKISPMLSVSYRFLKTDTDPSLAQRRAYRYMKSMHSALLGATRSDVAEDSRRVSSFVVETRKAYNKVWKPYNAAEARRVDFFFKFGGRSVPMMVGISGVDRASVSCYTPSLYKAIRYLLRFCRSFEVKFWFPNMGEWGVPLWCQMGRQ